MSVLAQLKGMSKDDIVKLINEVTKKDAKVKKLILACMNREKIESSTTITDNMVNTYMALYDMNKFLKNIDTLKATNVKLVYEMLVKYLIEQTGILANVGRKFGWRNRYEQAEKKLSTLDDELANVLKMLGIKSITNIPAGDNIHKLIDLHKKYFGDFILEYSAEVLYPDNDNNISNNNNNNDIYNDDTDNDDTGNDDTDISNDPTSNLIGSNY